MKKIITVIILTTICNVAWCTQILIGVDNNKLVIFEYWKFENGEKSNELMLLNPTNEKVDVIFRKNYQKEIYKESDILLKVNSIKPNKYILFKDAFAEIREIYTGGLMQVLINGERVGLYSLAQKAKEPITKINEGIIINHRSNTGSFLQYEIIYEDLEFKRNNDRRVKVVFLKSDFYRSGFAMNEKHNPGNIQIENIVVNNLKIAGNGKRALYFTSTDKLGTFEASFLNLNRKRRMLYLNFAYMVSKKISFGLMFNIPNRISFNKEKKYQKRKDEPEEIVPTEFPVLILWREYSKAVG